MVNLVSAVDRLALSRLVFKYHGMKFPKIFDACTDSGLCCHPTFNSTYQVVKMARDKNLPYILFYQDDVYPQNEIVEYIKTYIKYVPNDADVFQMGYV